MQERISQLLTAWHKRTIRGEALRSLTGYLDSPDDRLEKILANQNATKTARSEQLIGPDQADSLFKDVRQTRLWFLQTRRMLKRSQVKPSLLVDRDSVMQTWKLNVGDFTIDIDKDEVGEAYDLYFNELALRAYDRRRGNSLGSQFVIIVEHPLAEIELEFGFKKQFNLEIIFGGMLSPRARYATSTRLLQEMTEEEHQLADFYLKRTADHLFNKV